MTTTQHVNTRVTQLLTIIHTQYSKWTHLQFCLLHNTFFSIWYTGVTSQMSDAVTTTQQVTSTTQPLTTTHAPIYLTTGNSTYNVFFVFKLFSSYFSLFQYHNLFYQQNLENKMKIVVQILKLMFIAASLHR